MNKMYLSNTHFIDQLLEINCENTRGPCLSKCVQYRGKLNTQYFSHYIIADPSIAQLVERRTVEWQQWSLGRWFESGSKDLDFCLFFIIVLLFLFLLLSLLLLSLLLLLLLLHLELTLVFLKRCYILINRAGGLYGGIFCPGFCIRRGLYKDRGTLRTDRLSSE